MHRGTPRRQGPPHCQFRGPTILLNSAPADHQVGGQKSEAFLVISRGEGSYLAWFTPQMAYRRLKQMHVIPSALLTVVFPTGETVDSPAELMAKYQRLTSRPLFSILTPIYNTPAPWLREALESVCNQVYQEWELCLADDGSTRQETLDVLKEFRVRDPKRIKYARLSSNSGIAVASNTAARLATGTFLAFLDHDDVLTPDALLEMALRLEQTPEADCSILTKKVNEGW